MSFNYALRFTVFIFAVAVHYAHTKGDDLYHAVCLGLVCSSIVRHWCAFVTPVVALIDRVVAHLCYALCAYTHLVEVPSYCGVACLAGVLGLWICEHRMEDWARAHALLHVVGFVGIMLAVEARASDFDIAADFDIKAVGADK